MRRYSVRMKREISKARRLFCQLAVREMGYPPAQVARFLGVTTSAVVRGAHFQDLPEIENYLYVDLGVPYLSVPKTELNA